MNTAQFTDLLNKLENTHWQALVDGDAILMVDDLQLIIGPIQSANAIVRAPERGNILIAELKRDSLEQADALLNNYYLTHPLTLAGFNHQVALLIQEHGEAAFAAPFGMTPARTLFVDVGEVMAESPQSPRHRYGAFCELNKPLNETALKKHVIKWLESGDAHSHYLGMNVCRYNC